MSDEIFEKNLHLMSGFQSVPDGWLSLSVKDICTLGRGRVISQEEIDSHPGEYPVYSSQTMNNGEMGRMDSFEFEGDLITWTTDGANAGTVFFRSGRFNCTNVCGTLSPKATNVVDLRFLCYHLGRIAKNYVSYIGNPKLMNDVMSRVAFVLPPTPEQGKIARILTTLDNLIERTEALIAKYQAIKQGMMHDLFTRGVDEHGHLRPPYEEAPELYKQSDLGWIPKEWVTKTLNELISPGRPIVYGILMPGYGHPGGVPVIKVKDIKNGMVDESDLLLTSPEIDFAYCRSRVKSGDLLFTIRGTVGRTALVPPSLSGANITQDTARIAVVGGDVRFVRGYLNMPYPKRFIECHTLGVAVQGINLRDVRRIRIAFPPAKEQELLGNVLDILESVSYREQEQLAKLAKKKIGLMHDLLTGKVRVKVDEAEEGAVYA